MTLEDYLNSQLKSAGYYAEKGEVNCTDLFLTTAGYYAAVLKKDISAKVAALETTAYIKGISTELNWARSCAGTKDIPGMNYFLGKAEDYASKVGVDIRKERNKIIWYLAH